MASTSQVQELKLAFIFADLLAWQKACCNDEKTFLVFIDH